MMKNVAVFQDVSKVTLVCYLMLLISFYSGRVVAVSHSLTADISKTSKYTRADEYYSEVYQGEILVPINLLGAVGRPGVYHIPKQTDIVRLLSLAGGTRADANLEDVTIKRRSGETERTININLKQLVEERASSKPINLEANDIVLVTPHQPLISSNTLQTVGFISSLLGLVVSSIVIVNQLKSK
jgi:hypothetical protein